MKKQTAQEYDRRLFKSYRQTHGEDCINQDEAYDWYLQYYDCYYKKWFDKLDRSSNIIEIGCNSGYMLKVLQKQGFINLKGIDLSPDDIEYARSFLEKGAEVYCIDAFKFFEESNEKFDIIYTKAMLEHISKVRIFEILESIEKHLSEKGLAIVEVPNMDWIWATHERYMDFTHEVGFTKESLGQVMRNVFSEVQIEYTDNSDRFHGIKTWIARKVIVPLLYWSEPVVEKNCLFSRAIMGIGSKKYE